MNADTMGKKKRKTLVWWLNIVLKEAWGRVHCFLWKQKTDAKKYLVLFCSCFRDKCYTCIYCICRVWFQTALLVRNNGLYTFMGVLGFLITKFRFKCSNIWFQPDRQTSKNIKSLNILQNRFGLDYVQWKLFFNIQCQPFNIHAFYSLCAGQLQHGVG